MSSLKKQNQKSQFKWIGSIPDWYKSPSRSIKSALHLKRSSMSKESKNSQPLLIDHYKDSSICFSPNNNFNISPCYSIKYLGITKGQIGILSKRAPIPYISPLEACKDVPLAIINSSISDQKTSSRLLNKLITKPVPMAYKPESPKVQEIEKSITEEIIDDDFPDPEAYDEFVIHTYARPKGLITVKKEEFYDPPHIPIQIPYHRVGVSGWKLSRPKSTCNERPSKSSRSTRKVPHKSEAKTRRNDMPEYHNEPYLKFLAEKKCKSHTVT